MTLTDELKVLDDKIKPNQAQYDLNREAAKICTLLSEDFDKYEYMTGEGLESKYGVVQQVKSEHSPLDKAFNKELKNDDKGNKVIKHDIDLIYNSNFSKYSVFNFKKF